MVIKALVWPLFHCQWKGELQNNDNFNVFQIRSGRATVNISMNLNDLTVNIQRSPDKIRAAGNVRILSEL